MDSQISVALRTPTKSCSPLKVDILTLGLYWDTGKENGNYYFGFREQGLGVVVPLKYIEYGVYGDLIRIYSKPYSIYLRGTRISRYLE